MESDPRLGVSARENSCVVCIKDCKGPREIGRTTAQREAPRQDRMTAPSFTESIVEDVARPWLEGLGYAVAYGTAIVLGMWAAKSSGEAL